MVTIPPALKSVAGLFLFGMAVVVAGHFLANQIYDPLLEGTASSIWRVLNPLMVAALLLVLLVAFARKRRCDARQEDRALDREYLEANGTFYYAAALFLMLLWNWFGVEWAEPVNSIGLLWIVIDATFPLLAGSTALWLLRDLREKLWCWRVLE